MKQTSRLRLFDGFGHLVLMDTAQVVKTSVRHHCKGSRSKRSRPICRRLRRLRSLCTRLSVREKRQSARVKAKPRRRSSPSTKDWKY